MYIYIYACMNQERVWTSPYQPPNFTFVAFLVRPLRARDDLGSWILNGPFWSQWCMYTWWSNVFLKQFLFKKISRFSTITQPETFLSRSCMGSYQTPYAAQPFLGRPSDVGRIWLHRRNSIGWNPAAVAVRQWGMGIPFRNLLTNWAKRPFRNR